MRITHVKKSRIDQGRCSKCGDPLPKGSAYRWIKFRFGGKRKRCMKPTCAFRGSDMTTSDKIADFLLAQEQAQDALEAVRAILEPKMDRATIQAEFQSLGDELRESSSLLEGVAEGYNESAYNLEEYFSGSAQIDECYEKAQNAEEYQGAMDEAADAAEQFAETLNEEDAEWTVDAAESVLSEIESHVESGDVI